MHAGLWPPATHAAHARRPTRAGPVREDRRGGNQMSWDLA